MYRVAGIFALLSKASERDATVAIDLLQKASFANGKLVLSRIKDDHDLDGLRNNSTFKNLINTLESWTKQPNAG